MAAKAHNVLGTQLTCCCTSAQAPQDRSLGRLLFHFFITLPVLVLVALLLFCSVLSKS